MLQARLDRTVGGRAHRSKLRQHSSQCLLIARGSHLMAIRKVLGPSLSMPLRCENSVAARNAICEAGEANLTNLFHLTHRMHALMFPSVLPAFASSSLNTTNFRQRRSLLRRIVPVPRHYSGRPQNQQLTTILSIIDLVYPSSYPADKQS